MLSHVMSCRFWASPVVTLVANFVMDKWVRAKVVNGIDITIDFLGLVYFLVSSLTCIAACITSAQIFVLK